MHQDEAKKHFRAGAAQQADTVDRLTKELNEAQQIAAKHILNESKMRPWIQKAKALLYDCIYEMESTRLQKEAKDLILAAGGYDGLMETAESPLRWLTDDGQTSYSQLAEDLDGKSSSE